MSIFDSLFNKLTPTDKAALTAALGWLASIDREYKEKNPDAETRPGRYGAGPWVKQS